MLTRPKAWSTHVAAEEGQFVAKHHDFKIFGFSRPKQKYEQLQQALKEGKGRKRARHFRETSERPLFYSDRVNAPYTVPHGHAGCGSAEDRTICGPQSRA